MTTNSLTILLSFKYKVGRKTYESKYDYDVSDEGDKKDVAFIKDELALMAAEKEAKEAGLKGRVSRVLDVKLRTKKVYLKPGKYTGSVNLYYEFKTKDRKKEVVERATSDYVAISYVVGKTEKITEQELINKVIDGYFSDEAEIWSNYDGFVKTMYRVDNVNLIGGGVNGTVKELKEVKMKQETLKYDFLGDLTQVNKNAGQCVTDYIIYEAQKKNIKSITRPYLLKQFGEESLISGVSTEAILQWARDYKYASVHCLNPFLKTFEQFVANDEDRRVKLSLVFIVNNGHCYPITDDQMKRTIALRKRIDLENFTFDVKFEQHAYINNSVTELLNCKEKVIIVEASNLMQLLTDYTSTTKNMVYNIKFNRHRINAFELPETKQVILSGDDYKTRRDLCSKLFDMTKSELFVFKNQSFTQLATNYFEQTVGKLRKSEYSHELKDIYSTYKIAPYVAKVADSEGAGGVVSEDIQGFDITACFTSILINNETPYNRFTAFDVVETFGGRLHPGIFFVNKMIKMADNTIILPRNWYSLVLVKYLIEKHYITLQDITYMVRARRHLKADLFKQFAETLHALGDKRLVNHFIGSLNKQTQTRTKGVVTDDYDTAVSLLSDGTQIMKVDDLYHVRHNTYTELTQTHTPIWRHVIESSYILLDKLYDAVVEDNTEHKYASGIMQPLKTKVIAYNTDSIKVVAPKQMNLLPGKPGDIREETVYEIRGRDINEIEDNATYELKRKPINEVDEDIEFLKANACLVVGMPGCGKTEAIKRTFNDKSICFCYTNKAADVLRKRGIDNVHTFSSYFYELKANKPIDTLGQYDVIYVDEYSMVPSEFYGMLMQVKFRHMHIKFKFFGDTNQCRPVEDNFYDYYKHQTILYLTDYNIMELSYKFTRYDKSLYDVLMHLRETGRLPSSVQDKKVKQTYFNICVYNATRKRINRECFARFSEGKKLYNVNGRKYVIGMPVVICENRRDLDVYNSQIYKIQDIDAKGVTLADENGTKTIFTHLFTKKLIKYGFCMTVYKYQGSTINEEYSIYDTECMDFNRLYTALSRGVSLDKVHFNYSDLTYTSKKASSKSVLEEVNISVIKGKIYLLSDGVNYYVGSTEGELNDRLKQHKEKPVNKFMKEFVKKNINITLLESVTVADKLALQYEEDKYIKQYYDKVGDKLLNVKWNIKKRDVMETTITIVQKVDVERFKIVRNEIKKKFIIQYRDENGKKIIKAFGYAKDEPAALKKAQECQDALRKKYYN